MALDQQNILAATGNEDIPEPSAVEVGCIERFRLQWKPWKTYLKENFLVCSVCGLILVSLVMLTYVCSILFIYDVLPKHPPLGYAIIAIICLFTVINIMLYVGYFRKYPPFLASKYGQPIYGVSIGYRQFTNPVKESPAEDGGNRENIALQNIQKPVEKDVQPDRSSGAVPPDASSSDVLLGKSSSDAKILKRPQSLEHLLAGVKPSVKAEVHRSTLEIASLLPCSSKSKSEEFGRKSDNDPHC